MITIARCTGSLEPLGIAALLISISSGCMTTRAWMIDYTLDTSALRVASGQETALSTSRAGEEGPDDIDLIATDGDAWLQFQVTPGRILISIENRGAEPLSVDLAGASLIDGSGQVRELRTVSTESRPLEGELTVLPRSAVQVRLWPKDWLHAHSDGSASAWKGDSPLDGTSSIERSRETALASQQEDIGKSFELALPLRKAQERVTYRFRLTVNDLVPRKTMWA